LHPFKLTFSLFFVSCILIAQDSLILIPNGRTGKDAYLSSFHPDINFGDFNDISSHAWTNGGEDAIVRSLIEFDLSELKNGTIIKSAMLTFYASKNSPGGSHSTSGGSNEVLIQRVITPWDENTVCWNNQPQTTSLNEVTLIESVYYNEDYENIDVRQLIQDSMDDLDNSFGFLLRLKTEEIYRKLVFGSSDVKNMKLRPKLVIVY